MDGCSPALIGGFPLANLFGLLVPLLVQSVANGQFFSFVPTNYKTQTRPCSSDGDCDGSGDDTTVCWWLYDGCSTGQCMCDPRTHVTHSTGRCLRVRRINEACDSLNDTCSDMLECINGTCLCPHGRQTLSSLCIHPHWRPLGARCKPSTDICYHESAYGLAEREVECSRKGVCQCKEGYKEDRRTCRRLHIWEAGCRKDYDCEGGAVCVDEQCQCPTGYKSVAGNTKCAKIGAYLELPLKSRCDEINERRYCSRGLVCHRCKTNEAVHICAKYLPGIEADKYHLPSGEDSRFPSLIRNLFLLTVCACAYLGLVVR